MEQFSIWHNLQKQLIALPLQQSITICVCNSMATIYHTVQIMDVDLADDLITISSGNFILEFSPTEILDMKVSANGMETEYCFIGKDAHIYICIMYERLMCPCCLDKAKSF